METVKDSTFIGALLPLVVVIFIIAVGVVLLYQHFQKNLFIQKLNQETLKNIHQGDLLRSSIEAQEEEQKRIAHNLHDELGAVLSIMRMNIIMLEQQEQEMPIPMLTGLQNVRRLCESALDSTRNISHRLMPPQLEAFGLIKTLESVIGQINNANSLCIHLDVPSNLPLFSRSINLGLYRIIMELINNTIKHSGAAKATIDIRLADQLIICHYSDNGIGFSNDHINKGLGHKSIDGRVNALNGTLDIRALSGVGFHAAIQIPIQTLVFDGMETICEYPFSIKA